MLAARSLRLLLGACLVGAVFAVVIGGAGLVSGLVEVQLLLPVVAAAVSVAALAIALPRIDHLVQDDAQAPTTTPYSALATAGSRIQSGSVEQALPDLARVLAEATRSQCAEVWLAVEEKLLNVACYPAGAGRETRAVANLGTLLAQPDVDHVVPILDGHTLRAALSISKPGLAVTPDDQQLMQDLANGAGLLLRGAQLNAELAQRVRRADELAIELQASRQRLSRARDVERQRLIGELTQVTTDRLAALRAEFVNTQQLLSDDAVGTQRAQHAIARARTGLDELLDRFRVIARGVYPTVLRDEGPAGALDELAADLPRPVRLSGSLNRRWAWEVESGIYWLAASAMQQLAGRSAERPLHVHLEHTQGRLAVRINDSAAVTVAREVLKGLTVDIDRLAALGGDVEIVELRTGGIALHAWLPDQLQPSVDAARSGQATP
ncbi:MAG: hypothetical protein WCB57_11950 [Pseudonocardiaceae bacterium]